MNRRELFLVAVTIFITIITWIVADLYHIANTSQYKVDTSLQPPNITVSLDESVLTVLQERK